MKILVTGGSAFIGSTISDSLSTKYKVISPTSQQLNLLNASDVKDYLNKNSFDIVIHSANHLVHPLLKESKEIVEDLIVAAHSDAKLKLKSKTSEEISKITGGIDLPPGFKFPL